MKNKKGISLKNKLLITFMLVSFGVAIILMNWQTVYWEFIDPALNPGVTDINADTPSRFGFLGVTVLVLFLGALLYYVLVKRYLRQDVERQLREKDLVYSTIAHDLKTPMTSVQGFAKALSDGKIKPEEQQEIFDIIYRKTDSMNEMINMLFEYSKLGADGYKPALSKLDLCALIRDILADNYTDLEAHGIELEIDISDEPINIEGDSAEIKRAFTNLIVNIYKHNPSGIKAKVSVAKENGNAVVKISDSGNEIPKDVYIFEPFVTENTARTSGCGTGLGLAITKRIIERHKGKIYVDRSEPGYTKTFVVERCADVWIGNSSKELQRKGLE